MPSRWTDRLVGRWRAARALAQFARHFRNWREVWEAYRVRGTLPPLVLRNGLTLYHDPSDDPILLFRELFVTRCYTRGGFYRPGPTDTVLDLGANIGFFALAIQGAARGARVHSFEPAAATRARLERNVAANGLEPFVTVYPYAVTGAPGFVRLNRAAYSGHRSLFDRETAAPGDTETVRAVSLAEAVEMTNARAVDLLKIDVEGAEVEVVEGAGAATWGRVRRVAVEYHDLIRPDCRARVTRALTDQGFTSLETRPEPHTPGLGLIRAARAVWPV